MNLNKVMLIGRLGRDPETRYTNSGSAVANFSIATTDTWKDKQGQKQERTEWHNIVAWARLADFSQNYLKKGRLIYVEGRLQTRDWTDNQNVKHYKTEVVANNILFMEGREAAQRSQGGGGAAYEEPQQQQEGPPPEGGEEESPYMEDDIPF
jgi:single-strand DNA-binding protein